MSRKQTTSEKLKRKEEEILMLRQEVKDLQKAYNKEREDKLEIIRQCLNQLSGIDTDITSLEGQIFDAKMLISKALEQVNLINGKFLVCLSLFKSMSLLQKMSMILP